MRMRGRSAEARRRRMSAAKQTSPMSCGRSVHAKRVSAIAGSAATMATIGRRCAVSAAAAMSATIAATRRARNTMIPFHPSAA